MSANSPGSDPDAPSLEPDKVPGKDHPVEDAARPNEEEEAVNERVMPPNSPGRDPDAPSPEPDKVPGKDHPVEDAVRPNEEEEEAVNERKMSPNSPGSDPDSQSLEPYKVPGEDNPVKDTSCELRPLQRSNSEPSFALSLADMGNLDLDDFLRLDAPTPDVSILVGDFSTESFIDHEERSEAGLLRLMDEGSVFPAVVPDLPAVARHPSIPFPENENGRRHSQEAAGLQAEIHAIETQRKELGELIEENKTDAKLTEEKKRTTRILMPRPAESEDDRKTAETTRSRPQMEAKTPRGPYKCPACGNLKKDHICPLLLLVRRNEPGIQTAEMITNEAGEVITNEAGIPIAKVISDGDREILVGSDYDFCDDTETSEQNDSTEYDHDQQNHPKDANRKSSETPKSSNNQENLPETGEGAGRNNDDDADDAVAEESRPGIKKIETADADTAEDTQSANDNDSDPGNPAKTNPEKSAATPAKRKGDTDDASTLAKKSKNDESQQPQPEDSKETDSIGGPVEEEPPRNDQETIAANLRHELQVESDEEIVTVPV